MTNFNALIKRADRLLMALVGDHQDNALDDLQWPILRELLLKEALPFPEAYLAIAEMVVQLERSGRVSWDTAERAIYTALEPFMPARIAIAAALVQLQNEQETDKHPDGQ